MHLKTTWHHMRRSPYQTLAAVTIMALTFLSVSVFAILIIGSTKIITYFESKPQVTAFFKDDAKQDSIDALENDLKATNKVASMKFVTKDEALQIYKEQNKNDPLLLELVTADILPSSLEISAYNLSDLNDLSVYLKNNQAVDKVVYQQDVVSTLTKWTNAVRVIGAIVIVVLAIVSIFMMTTIISMKISHKREEIEIMQLIGATKWYISAPFVLEGVLYAVSGALIGWILSSGALLYATPLLADFLKGIPVVPAPWFFYLGLLGGELVMATVLGVFASLLAVFRYIK